MCETFPKYNVLTVFFIGIKELCTALADNSWLTANPANIFTNGDWMLSQSRTTSSRRCDLVVLGTAKLSHKKSISWLTTRGRDVSKRIMMDFTLVSNEIQYIGIRNSKLTGPRRSAWQWINWHRKITRTVYPKRNSRDTKTVVSHIEHAGGIWKGNILVADIEELETMDASEIYSKRLNAKEVIFPKRGEFIFPIADGRIKTPGGDQELRTSTLVRPRPIQGESNIDFLGEPEGSLPQPHDSLPVAGEAMNDFWSMSGSFIYRHHVEPRIKLCSPREESFPIPLKYIDVSRTTHTNLDVKQEKRIDDYWNIDGSRDLSDPWTGFTQFTLLDEKAPDGYTWSGARLTRKQLTSRPDHLW